MASASTAGYVRSSCGRSTPPTARRCSRCSSKPPACTRAPHAQTAGAAEHRSPSTAARLPRMELWIPDQAGREALGELPAGVACNLYRREGPPPAAIAGAEFLVPSHDTAGLLELL